MCSYGIVVMSCRYDVRPTKLETPLRAPARRTNGVAVEHGSSSWGRGQAPEFRQHFGSDV